MKRTMEVIGPSLSHAACALVTIGAVALAAGVGCKKQQGEASPSGTAASAAKAVA